MEKSKVYFTDFRARPGYNLLQKLQRLIKEAGINNIDFENKYVAIKIHFGEPGNLAYLRPNYSKAVADVVKELGGKPFLTDCNTLYVGGRKNAIDHIDAAYQNGFTPYSTGCHVIIADGLKGTDESYIDIDGEYVKTAKIGRAIMDADIVISLNHFKGHELAGFGGAIKNIGMGCGSRAGKMEMHSSGKPLVLSKKCKKCKNKPCTFICPASVFNYEEETKEYANYLKSIYEPLGYKCIDTSAITKEGIDNLKAQMQGKINLLSGHSGVGKSALVNALQPGLDLKTSEISLSNLKGKHTTTFAQMYHLDFGADIIDTPGIRSFGMVDFKKEEVALYFPEMKRLLSECKFYNCTHIHEPGCAIKQAVEEGEISSERYANYISIINTEEVQQEAALGYGKLLRQQALYARRRHLSQR